MLFHCSSNVTQLTLQQSSSNDKVIFLEFECHNSAQLENEECYIYKLSTKCETLYFKRFIDFQTICNIELFRITLMRHGDMISTICHCTLLIKIYQHNITLF